MDGSGKITRILTIEDEDSIRKTIAAYLEDSGFVVLQASGGEEGINIFRREKPDVVLTDLRMPEFSGIEVIKVISSEDSEVPIVVVSGTGVLQDSIEAIRCGAWDYITKPIIDLDILEITISRVLERSRLLKANRHYREYLEDEVCKRTNELEASLQEKTILLKEIHHRVKNNMQVIASIINLQAERLTDDTTKEIFRSLQTRIYSMASVHEALYNSRNLAQIDFKVYLENMLRSLMMVYKIGTDSFDVKLDIEEIYLGVDYAVPCGLIVNELLTNAMKYAFPDSSKGELKVSMALSAEDHKYVLEISDNGVGLPENFDIKCQQSLGMLLVNALVGQIDASLEIKHTGGTCYKIKFDVFPDNAE